MNINVEINKDLLSELTHLQTCLATAEGVCAERKAELDQIKMVLANPAGVWINMLRGTIARPRALDHYEEVCRELEEIKARRCVLCQHLLDDWRCAKLVRRYDDQATIYPGFSCSLWERKEVAK